MVRHLYFVLFYVTILAYKGRTRGQTTSQPNPGTSGFGSDVCSLELTDADAKAKIDGLQDEDTTLIYFRFLSEGDVMHRNYTSSRTSKSKFYKPFEWAWTAGDNGSNLLTLRKDFSLVAMTTLSIGVEEVALNLTQTPRDCLLHLNDTAFELVMRDFLLHDFGRKVSNKSRKAIPSEERICNMYLRSEVADSADFYYECCHVTKGGKVVCEELVPSAWMKVLLGVIIFLNFAAVLYAPLIIPSSCYKERSRKTVYTHKLKEPLILSVRKTESSSDPEHGNEISKSDLLARAPSLRRHVTQMKNNINYNIKVSKLVFKVKADEMLEKGDSPIGIISSLYKSIILCRLRHKESMAPFCSSRLLPGIKATWFHLLRSLMVLVFGVIIASPWIARVIVFYNFEAEEVLRRKQFAHFHGVTERFSGSLVVYFTPVHVVFLICYTILVLDAAFLGVVGRSVPKMLKSLLRGCMQGMKSVSYERTIGWSVQVLLLPLRKWGLFGLVPLPFYLVFALPFTLAIMASFFIPSINILVRLLIHLFFRCPKGSDGSKCCEGKLYTIFNFQYLLKKENYVKAGDDLVTTRTTFGGILLVLFAVLSLVSFTFLFRECVVFVVEYFVFSLIGIILNADFVLKYLTLALMIIFYTKSCFGSVTKKYANFLTTLHEAAAGRVQNEIETNQNLAYCVPITKEGDSPRLPELILTEDKSKLKWKTWQIIVFYDGKEKVRISEKFFFEIALMKTCNTPGSLVGNLALALTKLSVIVVFLLFVLLIVNVFGEKYDVTGFNQMIATLVTGFLPWAIENFFSSMEASTFDKDDVEYNLAMDNKIKKFSQVWSLPNLSIDSMTEADASAPESHTSSADHDLEETGSSVNEDGISSESTQMNPVQNGRHANTDSKRAHSAPSRSADSDPAEGVPLTVNGYKELVILEPREQHFSISLDCCGKGSKRRRQRQAEVEEREERELQEERELEDFEGNDQDNVTSDAEG